MRPSELIAKALDQLLNETDCYSTIKGDPPEDELEWATALITSRIEELDLKPTEAELYELMKLRMKV